MRLILFLICILLISSCTWKPYPPEKYNIEQSYRDLVSPYKSGDTLLFKDSSNKINSFLISKIDSVIYDTKGYFINRKNEKIISVSYKQIPIDKWAHEWIGSAPDSAGFREHKEDATLIDIIRDPAAESTELNFNFQIFRGCTLKNLPLHTDTLNINGINITGYYKIEYCDEDVKNLSDIKVAYSTIKKGIMAYQLLDGTWWIRIN